MTVVITRTSQMWNVDRRMVACMVGWLADWLHILSFHSFIHSI